MNYVLLPIAHGVQFKDIQANYAQPFIDKIREHLTEQERGFLVPMPYNYTAKTNARQKQMFEAVEAGLGNQELRRIKHTVGSDVTWSFIVAKDGKPTFSKGFVGDMDALIHNALITYKGARVVCVGHSQGTQNFYGFFFDFPGKVDCFISMGSPISMNSGAYEDFGKVPPNLGSWINFYNQMDFISSRLQGVHPCKAIADFVTDYDVPLGWNPLFKLVPNNFPRVQIISGLMAHVLYWKSDFVAKIVAEKVRELIHKPA